MKNYVDLLEKNEDWLMNRILDYAQKFEFTKYTSTLAEAWRLSINGLSHSLILAAKHYSHVIPEFHPDEKYVKDPISEFGVVEARKHRHRGVTLGMFLGLMKYYQASYIDLIELSVADEEDKRFYQKFTDRCFDRIEIAYCIEWTSRSDEKIIDELQDLNRKMTNEKNKYLTIFESASSPIILLDKNMRISNLNQAAASLFTDFKIAGSIYYSETYSDSSFKKLNEQVLEFMSSNPDETSFEIPLATNRGELLFSVKLKKMQDVSDKFEGTVIMLDDITETRKAVEEIREREQKLRKLNATKDKLFSIIAHDLRSPFNSILGLSDLLISDSEKGEKESYDRVLPIIRASAKDTLGLLNNLLDWATTQTGRLKFNPEKLMLNEIIQEVEKVLAPSAELKSIFISSNKIDNIEVKADQKMLRTILMNLISNAIKFTNPDGNITISTKPNNDYIQITVSDSGVGMTEETRKKLFNLENGITSYGTANEKGSGLGLILCKEFVEKHGGKIWIDSEFGKGSELHFTIPDA